MSPNSFDPETTGGTTVPPGAKARLVQIVVLGCLIVVLVLGFQAGSGSMRSELGSHPDEAAHFVTGLMVHDYLLSGFHQSPLRYADDYYRHYPKIGLGVWPPFFYLVQAVWTLVFPVGVQSLLWLMAALAIALAIVLAWALLKEFGLPAAATGAVLFVSLPLVQQYSNMVMAEMLSGLLMFCAVLCFARFLKGGGEGGTWAAAGFGVFAGLAIMTKGTGLALALMPPLAIAFTGRFGLLKKRGLWIAALIVLVIAGPWTWHFRNQGRGGWEEPSPSLHFTKAAMLFYGRQLIVAQGWLLALAAVGGVVRGVGGKKDQMGERENHRRDACVTVLALVAAIWIFQVITPVGLEARHLLPAMPALIFLAMGGLHEIAGAWPKLRWATYGLLLLVFFGLPFVQPASVTPGYGSLGNEITCSPFRLPKKEWHGFKAMADAAVAGKCRHMLVASDARGEGMFIADIAMADPHRPSYVVDRASKTLASSTWSGGTYESFYSSPSELAAALARSDIEAIVTDSSLAMIPPHEQMLQHALAGAEGSYRMIQAGATVRDGKATPCALRLYLRRAGG